MEYKILNFHLISSSINDQKNAIKKSAKKNVFKAVCENKSGKKEIRYFVDVNNPFGENTIIHIKTNNKILYSTDYTILSRTEYVFNESVADRLLNKHNA